MRTKTKRRASKSKKIMKMPEEKQSAWKSFWNRYCNL
jgi:hypothetical protein